MIKLLIILPSSLLCLVVMWKHKLLYDLLLLLAAQILAIVAAPLLPGHAILLLKWALTLASFLQEDFLHSLFHNVGFSLHVAVRGLFCFVACCLIHHFKRRCNVLWVVRCVLASSWWPSNGCYHIVFEKASANLFDTSREIFICYVIEINVRKSLLRETWFAGLGLFGAELFVLKWVFVLFTSDEFMVTTHDEGLLLAADFSIVATVSCFRGHHSTFRWSQ